MGKTWLSLKDFPGVQVGRCSLPLGEAGEPWNRGMGSRGAWQTKLELSTHTTAIGPDCGGHTAECGERAPPLSVSRKQTVPFYRIPHQNSTDFQGLEEQG